jgi:polyphenol oxidase
MNKAFMNSWTWQTSNGTSYLTCELLKDWPHGFFTRQSWPHLPTELVNSLQAQAKVCQVKQVHGKTVLAGTEMQRQQHPSPEILAEDESPYPHADGLHSDEINQSLWVCSADCTPVLIGDRTTGHVAAVHAGWRGTAARIVPVAIEQLMAQGSQLEDLRVAMGPAIAGTVYQVTAEVAQSMANSLQENASETFIQQLMDLNQPPLLSDPEPGRVKLDVRRVNALQLEQMGVTTAQIAIAPHCTFQDPERFFSYRRDGLKKVQWSGIVSQENP